LDQTPSHPSKTVCTSCNDRHVGVKSAASDSASQYRRHQISIGRSKPRRSSTPRFPALALVGRQTSRISSRPRFFGVRLTCTEADTEIAFNHSITPIGIADPVDRSLRVIGAWFSVLVKALK
jgi:hypothetical protein